MPTNQNINDLNLDRQILGISEANVDEGTPLII
jgi:hypothetical protein